MSAKEKQLSAEELRARLHQTLRSRGIIDSLKSQLRNRLVVELQQATKTKNVNSSKSPSEDNSLFLRAANSLVAEHLQKCSYEYTLSVFLPEINTTADKLFSVKDLLHLLHLDPQSKLYRTLNQELNKDGNQTGFLWQLICELAKQGGHSKVEASIQTEDSIQPVAESLDSKLRSVDEVYSNKLADEKASWNIAIEEKILAYQRQLEERKNKELRDEMERFRKIELARMRLEERENSHKEINKARQEMEKDFGTRLEALNAREKESLERLKKQREIQEAESYEQRQKLLKELDSIKQREADLKLKAELHEKAVQLEQEKVKIVMEQVKAKEASVNDVEKRNEERLHAEIRKYTLKLDDDHRKKMEDLDARDGLLKQKLSDVDLHDASKEGVLEELNHKKTVISKLQVELEQSKQTVNKLMQQNNTLKNQAEQSKDYKIIKEQELKQRTELESLRIRLSELTEDMKEQQKTHKDLVKDLMNQIAQPSHELISLRDEVKASRQELRRKEKNFNDVKRSLESKLEGETHRSQHFQRLYEEQLIRQREMTREFADLKHSLEQTQTALNLEMQRKRPLVEDVDGYSLDEVYELPTRRSPHSASRNHTSLLNRVEEDEDRLDPGIAIVAESQAMFEKLEKEAQALEESYRQFQNRMRSTGTNFFPVPQGTLGPLSYRSMSTHRSGMGVASRREFQPLDSYHGTTTLGRSSRTSDQNRFQYREFNEGRIGNVIPVTNEHQQERKHLETETDHRPNSSHARSVEPDNLQQTNNGAITIKDLVETQKPSGQPYNSDNQSRAPRTNQDKQRTLAEHYPLAYTDYSNMPASDERDSEQPKTLDEVAEKMGLLAPVSPQGEASQDRTHDTLPHMSPQGRASKDGTHDTLPHMSPLGGASKDRTHDTLPRMSPQGGASKDGTRDTLPHMPPLGGASKDRTHDTLPRMSPQGGASKEGTYDTLHSTGTAQDRVASTGIVQSSSSPPASPPSYEPRRSLFTREQSDDEKEQNVVRPISPVQDSDEGDWKPAATVSLDDAWGKTGDGRGVGDKAEEEEDHGVEAEDKDDHQDVLLDASEGDELSQHELGGSTLVSLDSAWRSTQRMSTLKDSLELGDLKVEEEEEAERRREQELQEWEEEKRRREEKKLQEEQEAWERQQRELMELTLLEEKEKKLQQTMEEEEEKTAEEKSASIEREKTPSPTPEADIDPVMLQYMQMVQKRKEESKDNQADTSDQDKEDKILSVSEDIASIGGISEDEGFSW